MGNLLSTSSSDLGRLLRKLTLAIGLFLAINILLYLPINYIYLHSYGGKSGAQINNVLRKSSDIFIFGASRASHHYIPSKISLALDMSVFNAGDDGKNAVYQLGLLRMLLKRSKPKMIMYEVGDLTTDLDGGAVDLFPYYYTDADVKHILKTRDTWAPVKFVFPLYAYNRKVLAISKGWLFKHNSSGNGYMPLYGEMNPAEIRRISQRLDSAGSKTPIDQYALECFEKFVQICKQNDIKLCFVYSPVYIPMDPEGESLIISIARDNGIRFYDFGTSADYNWHPDLFKDAIHLNSEGAEVFTNDMINELQNICRVVR